MSTLRKGVAYSVIAIVALVGILAVLGGLSYQSTVGSGVSESDSLRVAQDDSTQKLEYTKGMVLQNVRFSTLSATLDITKNGGTTDPETYWTCNNVPQPVTSAEFMAAISNGSLQYMIPYIEALKKEPSLVAKDITLSDPECMSVDLPEGSACNHLNCDYFGSGVADETLDVSSPVVTSYKGPLNVNDVGPVRAVHFHNVLYNFFENNEILQVMSTSMAAECPQSELVKLQIAMEDVCDELKKRLDPDNPEYIICEMKLIPAPHTDCTRLKKESTCFSGISLQSGNERAALLHLEDLKYEPLGDATHMEWNIKMVFEEDVPECTPINNNLP